MKILKTLFFISLLQIAACTSFPTKSKETKVAAPLAGGFCAEGALRQGYTSPTTTGDFPCAQGDQVCVGGKWTGPTLYMTCDNFTKNCDGHPHGSTMSGYMQSTSPHGVPCVQTTRVCINGTWTGPELFPGCTEQ